MMDFNEKIYEKIFDLGIKYNILANCREYPALVFSRQRIDFERIKEALARKFSDRRLACGLYVHFPFCENRCSFCKYYSEVVPNKDKEIIFDKYLSSLEKELKLYQIDFSKVELDNLCLGGGTPTLLDERRIGNYLDIIYRFFRFRRGAQISIEGTPETITISKIKEYKRLGINRVSLGLQSLNDEILKRTGRMHTVKDVERAFDVIRKGGIKYIAADILWGLPGESSATYERTIKRVIKLSPEFVEGFLLTTGGRVKIARSYPEDADIDEIINGHKEEFLNNGYRIYSWGNFLGVTKKGVSHEYAVNQNTDGLYNCRAAVLGIGAGASSHFDNFKYKIVSDSKAYSKYLKNGVSPLFFGTRLNRDDYKRQYIISRIGFFRSIAKKRYKELFGKDLAIDFPREMDYLKECGIIRETKNQYYWNLGQKEMGHRSFFEHIIKYWYHPKYIDRMLG